MARTQKAAEGQNPGMIRVRAKEKGYFGQVREEGEEFDIPEDTSFEGAWFVKVDETGSGEVI